MGLSSHTLDSLLPTAVAGSIVDTSLVLVPRATFILVHYRIAHSHAVRLLASASY